MSYQIAGSGAATLAGGLRRILDERTVAYGGWCMVPSAFAAEVVSASGCDWLCIDQQHGLIDDDQMRLMVAAAAIRRTPVLVRVAWNEPAAIMRALDAGADGVIVPMVNTAAEAQAAAQAAHYPPHGFRSYGPLRSMMADPGFTPEVGNHQTVCLAMIETVEAFGNLEAILDVPGVDGALVGPSDLSISHTGGVDGAGRSPKDVGMIEEIARACQRRGLVAAMSGIDPDDSRRWEKAGYTLISVPSDAALIGEGMTNVLASVRNRDA